MSSIHYQVTITTALLFCLFAPAAHAVIAFDSAASTSTTADLTFTYNVTVVSAISNYCVVGVTWRRSPVGAVSTITVDSNTATFLVGITETTYGTNRVELWGIKNVATGSRVVSVTLNGSSTDNAVSGTSCYTGVHQGAPTGAGATNEGAGTTAEITGIVSAAGEMIVDTARGRSGGSTVTAAVGQTERWDDQDATYTEETASSDKAGAASVTMSWTINVDDAWVIAAIQLKPAAAAGATYRRRQIRFE